MKKYEFTGEVLHLNNKVLHRIRALRDFGEVEEGSSGGFIEKEVNLSHKGNCWIYNDAKVYDDALVFGDAEIEKDSDYMVFKNWWSSGRYFTWTKSNNMWRVGCFYGTGKELIERAYDDSELSGREYERVVNYVNQILSEK